MKRAGSNDDITRLLLLAHLEVDRFHAIEFTQPITTNETNRTKKQNNE
jgi:hypothetical protein